MVDREEGELSEEGELPDEPENAQHEPVKASETVSTAAAQTAPAAAPTETAPTPPAAAAAASDLQQATAVVTEQPALQPAAQSHPHPSQQPGPQPATTLSRPKPENLNRELQRQQQQQQQQQQQPQQLPGRDARDRGRVSIGGGGGGGGEHDSRQHHHGDRHKSEREKAELAQELDKLTFDLSFQEIRSNWVTACQTLKNAIKKLDKLLRRVKRKREDDVEMYPACHEYAARIATALKHVTVICSTGLGKTVDMEVAHNLMRSAVNYRHEIFSLAQKKELEQQIKDSREFKYLFTDRDKGRPSSKPPAAASADQPQQRVPLARGDRGQQQQQQQQQQRQPPGDRPDGRAGPASRDDAGPRGSHAAAAAAVGGGGGGGGVLPTAPAAPAPPPPGSAGDASSTGQAAAAAAAAQQQQQQSPQQQQQQPVPATPGFSARSDAAGAGKPAAAGASAATAAAAGQPKGSQIRIVLNSTSVGAADAAAATDQGTSSEAAAAAGGSSSGAKRAMPEPQDLLADDEGSGEQAAKRTKFQQQQQQQQIMNLDDQHEQQQQQPPLWESAEYAAAVSNMTDLQDVMQRLLRGQRLCLVLDLDHTLVNSAKFNEIDGEWDYKLEQIAAEQLSRPKESRDLFRLPRLGMWTKLRPGVREFLRRAADKFELWIYTAGSKAYADAMVDLLDPQSQYFGGRVIAQGAAPTGADDGATADPLVIKRLMQGLEGCEPVVLIVDDSSTVWPHDRRNLFVVERYIFFPSSRKRFGMVGKSLMEIDRDECPRKGMLMSALRVIEALHDSVFNRLKEAPPSTDPTTAGAWDVRTVMAEAKKQVLSGVQLVFSRVIPLEADPRQHPLWQLAEQFGASCSEQCTDATTHVVATHGGTEKVMWARQNGKYVVGPAWLECSCILWRCAAEERFPPPQ